MTRTFSASDAAPVNSLQPTVKERWTAAFLLGFGIVLAALLPLMIYNKGIFLYYGDFNSQQLPFYVHAHRAVREGLPLWDWQTDLGTNFLASYSFYLLGSPFFWLTIPFPTDAVVYLIPWLLALKHGVAALTAYGYLRRFVQTPDAALIGALLYALSGFQGYNIFFNHFQDVTAFFPLLLLAMEMRMKDNRKGVFALVVALHAVLSYFFFVGEVLFCVVYFAIRCLDKSPQGWQFTWKKFICLGVEAVAGVLLSAFLFLPSILMTMENPRTDQRLWGLDLLLYSDRTRFPRIIQSFFMIPDMPARPNLFASDYAKWSSVAGYLPLFSMAGVIAFMQRKKKHWGTRLIWISIIMAGVPILNALFSAATSSYYARWFYMPILIMAMMTARTVDDKRIAIDKALMICLGVMMIFLVCAAVPTKGENGAPQFFSITKYPYIFWIFYYISLAGLLACWWLFGKARQDGRFMKKMTVATSIGCFATIASMVWYGVSIGPYPEQYIGEAIQGGEKISLPGEEEIGFYRVDISKDRDNYPMFWGYSNIRCFQSTVSASILEFYPSIGVERNVATRADTDNYALRGLTSVRYYFEYANNEPVEKSGLYLPGFEYIKTENNFHIYENKAFVPMGFTYDYYIPKDLYEEQNEDSRSRQLMKGVVLDEEQVEKYGRLLTEINSKDLSSLSANQYLEDCAARAATACDTFQANGRGFTATITLPKDNLVFFTIPWDKGFAAFVDGQEAPVEKVDNGLMAIPVPAGSHNIELKYTPTGFKTGILLSVAGAVLLGGYLLALHREKAKRDVTYDYKAFEPDLPESSPAAPADTVQPEPSFSETAEQSDFSEENNPSESASDLKKEEPHD